MPLLPALAPEQHSARNRSYSKSPGALARGLRGRAASASSRSSSLGGDEDRRPLFKSGGSRSHGSISTAIAATTASNTLSNNRTIISIGGEGSGAGLARGGGVNGSSEGNVDGGKETARFSKPTKAVSFAGDESISDSPAVHSGGGGGLRRSGGGGSGNGNGRTASAERSSELSPLRGSRLALLPQQGNGYGAAAGGSGEETNGKGGWATASPAASKTSSAPQEDLNGAGDVYGWGLSELEHGSTSGDAGSHAPAIEEGEEEEDDEGEMASFIVLDCSRVTNVSITGLKLCCAQDGRIEIRC